MLLSSKVHRVSGAQVIPPLLHAVPLALGAAISPALVAVTVELLATGGSRRRIEVLAYLLGGAVPLLGIGVLGLFAVPAILGPSNAREQLSVDVVDAVLGLALLVLATRLVIRRLRQPRDQGGTPARTGANPPSLHSNVRLVGLGIAMMLTNVSTILLSAGALREIERADISPIAKTAALMVLVGVAMTPVWFPLLIDVVAPRASARVLEPISRLLERHGTAIAASISTFFGLYLLLRSVLAF